MPTADRPGADPARTPAAAAPPAADPLAGSGVVVVDKPAGMTSHDVVARVRRILGTRRVGHSGTLDPMATGVLVLGVGRGTRFLAHVHADAKAYAATIRLGAATVTDDAEGEPLGGAPAGGLAEEAVRAAVAGLTGELMQVPAAVSAVRVAGERAHARVRRGEAVAIPPRPVTVARFEITALRRPGGAGGRWLDLDVVVECSAGTYVRALARDLGAALGVGGHLTALRRTAAGPFTLADAVDLDGLAERGAPCLDLDTACLRCFPVREVDAAQAAMLAQGRWLEPVGRTGVHAALGPDGRVPALIEESGRRARTVFVVRPATLG